MLESLRTFVHWADALLHVDCTREKCDAVYTVVNHRIGEEQEKAEHAKEARKESAKFFQDLIVSAVPAIVTALTQEKPKTGHPTIRVEPYYPTEPEGEDPRDSVHIGRRPVVVDRQDQQPPSAPEPDLNPPEVRPEEIQIMNKINEALRTMPAHIASLSHRLDELNERLRNLESFTGSNNNLNPTQS